MKSMGIYEIYGEIYEGCGEIDELYGIGTPRASTGVGRDCRLSW